MHKQKAPARDSRFVALRRASDELGLPYSLLYSAVKSGQVVAFSVGDDAKRPVIYVLRASLDAFIAKRLTREAA